MRPFRIVLASSLLALGATAQSSDPLELSLDEAIARAMSSNLALRQARLDSHATAQGLGEAWGAFDATWFLDATASESIIAPSPQFVGGQFVGNSPATDRDLVDFATGLRGTLLSGIQWQVDVGTDRTFIEAQPNRQTIYRGDWNVSLTAPLLRNGADEFPRTQLELARQDAFIAWASAETAANDIILSVIEAYWNYAFTLADVRTRERSVELANELLNLTQRRFQEGLQTRIDVIEVEAEVATREEELLRAQYGSEDALDALRALVFAPVDSEEWMRPIELGTQPRDPDAVDTATELDEAIDTALQYRPEIVTAQLQRDRSAIQVRRAENQVRPRLDLTTFYGWNTNERSFTTSLDNLGNDFDSFGVTLAWEMPIGNRAAEFALRRARLDLERAEVAVREAEVDAVSEVRAAVRDVSLQAARVVATTETARLNEERYRGELRQLENDLSTSFQVREAQRDLFTALDNQTRAILDLEIARARLLKVQGRLLESYGFFQPVPDLSIEEAPEPPSDS